LQLGRGASNTSSLKLIEIEEKLRDVLEVADGLTAL